MTWTKENIKDSSWSKTPTAGVFSGKVFDKLVFDVKFDRVTTPQGPKDNTWTKDNPPS